MEKIKDGTVALFLVEANGGPGRRGMEQELFQNGEKDDG
jgi:hypothetical protein